MDRAKIWGQLLATFSVGIVFCCGRLVGLPPSQTTEPVVYDATIKGDRPLAATHLLPDSPWIPVPWPSGDLLLANGSYTLLDGTPATTAETDAIDQSPPALVDPRPTEVGSPTTSSAFVPFVARIDVSASFSGHRAPACQTLAPFAAIPCTMGGFDLDSDLIREAADLQVNVFFPADRSSPALSNVIPVDRIDLRQLTNTRDDPAADDDAVPWAALDDQLLVYARDRDGCGRLFVHDPSAPTDALFQATKIVGICDEQHQWPVVYADRLLFSSEISMGRDRLVLYQPEVPNQPVLSIFDTSGYSENDISQPVVAGGRLYFVARNAYDESKVFAVQWDGIGDPTLEVACETSGSRYYSDDPTELTGFNDKVFFAARDYSGHRKLFRCDARNDLAEQLTNVNTRGSDDPQNLTVVGDRLYLTLRNGGGLQKLFAYNDTLVADRLVKVVNLLPGGDDSIDEITGCGGAVYFSGASDPSQPIKLFQFTPGASTGSLHLVSNTTGEMSLSDAPTDLTCLHNNLYFSAQNSQLARKLFRFDPDTRAVHEVSNTTGDRASSDNPRDALFYGGKVYFVAMNQNGQEKLFAYDPTAEQQAVFQVASTSGWETLSDAIAQPMVFNAELYFGAVNEFGAHKLFVLCDYRAGCH